MAYVFGIDGTENFVPEPKQSYENQQQSYADDLETWNLCVKS